MKHALDALCYLCFIKLGTLD